MRGANRWLWSVAPAVHYNWGMAKPSSLRRAQPPSTTSRNAGYYEKPSLSLDEQIDTLSGRGLLIGDREQAAVILQHIGYYRLSGYTQAFYTEHEQFAGGTTIEYVDDAYRFDQRLQNLIWRAVSYLEVDLRSSLSRLVAEFGPFAHARFREHPLLFRTAGQQAEAFHRDWLSDLRRDIDRNPSAFTTHFRTQYPQEPDLPIWMAVETMTFGRLSKLLGLIDAKAIRPICSRYGMNARSFVSAVRALSYVRNVCAHHQRLWDLRLTFQPELPRGQDFHNVPADRVFVVVLLLLKMLSRLTHRRNFYHEWANEVRMLLFRPPQVADPTITLGLPDRWQQLGLWPRSGPESTAREG